MFMGEYQHSIDAKGRLIVPAKFRDGLGEHFVVTKGLDNCLFAYPQEEWKIFEEKLKQLPLTSTGARKFVRFFFAGAVECDLDNQGRIILPSNLREYAGLKKDTVLKFGTRKIGKNITKKKISSATIWLLKWKIWAFDAAEKKE